MERAARAAPVVAEARGTTESTPTGKTEYAPYYEIGSDTGAFKNLTDLEDQIRRERR